MLPRLTSHARHRRKYFDVPMTTDQGFVFTWKGERVAGPALTLRDLVCLLASSPAQVLAGHARRGDFSRWIRNVLRDHRLASSIRAVERQYEFGHIDDLTVALGERIRERYSLPAELDTQASPEFGHVASDSPANKIQSC
jgi:hypothetical protein